MEEKEYMQQNTGRSLVTDFSETDGVNLEDKTHLDKLTIEL